MRWLKWTLIAVWLAVHGWLWSALPPVHYARLPAAGWIALADEGRRLIATTLNSIRVYETASGQLLREWPFAGPIGATSPIYDLAVSRDGRRAVVFSMGEGAHLLFDLDTGRQRA